MTRVLHVIPTLGRGGAERTLVQLIAAGRAAGFDHRVAAFATDGAFASAVRDAGVGLDDLAVASAAGFPAGVWRLARIVRAWRPDVIQGWLYYGDLAAFFGRVLAGVPHPRLYWNIRCSELDFSAYHRLLRLAVRLEARLSSRPDAIVVNSEAGARAHEAHGFDASRFVLIPNGVDAALFAPDPEAGARARAELGLEPGEPVVLHAARVDPQKDHATLVAAAALAPGVRFLAAGRGTERLAGPANLTRLGDRTDIAALMNAADLVISTSAYGEGFPNVVAEGLACGRPAVSTDCGDARSLVGETGRIVARRDPAAAAAAVTELLALPEAERRAMGEAARARILGLYSIDACREKFHGLWRAG